MRNAGRSEIGSMPANHFAPDGRTGGSRYFFAGIGAFCILIAIAGFAPNLYRAFHGLTPGGLPFPLVVHVHAAIMMGWLVLYTVQASLVARGNLGRHRRTGWMAMLLAAAVWLSMAVATVNALQRYDPDKFAFLVKPLLIQLGTMAVFPIFVAWAVLARRHADWHKRMMVLATFTLVQAALDRMAWLPDEGLPMFWHAGLRLYVLLLLPLCIFDLATLRRIHPATLIGSGIIVAMHGVVSYCWNHAGWNDIARAFWMWLL